MSASRRVALACSAVIAVAAVALLLPWITEERSPVTGVPSPPDLAEIALVDLRAGQQACTEPVVAEAGTAKALVTVRTGRGAGPPLAYRFDVDGEKATPLLVRAGGYADRETVDLSIGPLARDVRGTLCVGPRRGRVQLEASASFRRARTTVGGRGGPAVVLRLEAAQPRRVLDAPALDRMTAFRPGWVSPGAMAVVLLVLLGLAVVGAPWAYARALATESGRRTRRPTVGG